MDRVRYLSLPKASPLFHLIGQHETIATAIEKEDLPAAEAALRTHLSEILGVLERFQREMPHLFADD